MFLDVSLLECESIKLLIYSSSRDVLRNSLGIPVIRQRFGDWHRFYLIRYLLFATSFTNFHLESRLHCFPVMKIRSCCSS